VSKPTIKLKPGQRQCPKCSMVMGSRARACKKCDHKFPKKIPPPVKVNRGKRFCPECFKNGTATILPSKVNPCPKCGYKFPPKSRSSSSPDENLVRDFIAKCGGVEQAKSAIDRFSADQQKQAAWSKVFDQGEPTETPSAQELDLDDYILSSGLQ